MSAFSKNPPVWNHDFRTLGNEFFSDVKPVGLTEPFLLHCNESILEQFSLSKEDLLEADFVQWASANSIPDGANPLASVYSGHQFGQWAGQLGDGRAMLLGEWQDSEGELWDIQLKGGGLTPYSRMGDGRAVMRSTIREYIAGEAMHGLGIATTRAIAICGSIEPVHREITEEGAVLVRTAKSHVRFGSFQHFAVNQRPDLLQQLLDYSIDRWYPDVKEKEDQIEAFLLAVTERTAVMIAGWMSVGFCHGVMNTDNMSIIGDTLDYGPYGFLDQTDWHHICNHSDNQGRYTFGKQAEMALWNLFRLTEALGTLVEKEQVKTMGDAVSEMFHSTYRTNLRHNFMKKLGVSTNYSQAEELVHRTFETMHYSGVDFTLFFRNLSHASLEEITISHLKLSHEESASVWLKLYLEARAENPFSTDWLETQKSMLAVNPKFVARNYLIQKVIEEEDISKQREKLEELLSVLANPFEENEEYESLSLAPPEDLAQSPISCSS